MELSQGPPPQPQGPPPQSSQAVNQQLHDIKAKSMQSGPVYHINNLDQGQQQHQHQQQQQQQSSQAQKMQVQKGHVQQISLEKYHMEKGQGPAPPNHLPDGMYRMPMGMIALPPQSQQVQLLFYLLIS